MREYRNIVTTEKTHVDLEARERRKKERKEEAEQLINERQAELMARVKAGDPLAHMQLAKPQSKEYWEAYKDYEIEYAKSWGKSSKRIVNDIPVYDADFAEKVIITTKELGHVVTNVV